MHPANATARCIADGDIIRLFNARGTCLAAVRLTEDIRLGVVQLPTGPGTIRTIPMKTSRCVFTVTRMS